MEYTQTWGRASKFNIFTYLSTLSILLFTPLLVILFYFLISGDLPLFDWKAVAIFASWLCFQLVLAVIPDVIHRIFPKYTGGIQQGIITPAGNQLSYQINGLQAWLISHVVFLLFVPATIIVDHWGSLLIVANIAGYTLALFAFIKARTMPTHREDCKQSGNWLYDFYMGIEFNPRIGPIDFKLFFNGRPGIIAWTLINLSCAAKQYATLGYVTNSMILVNVLQAIYVLDFFWNEAWYLKTIDIAHDHFGWMLAWGDLVWLPYMYTLQAFFLLYHPIDLSTPYALFVLFLGVIGYIIFRSANNQRVRFRANVEAKIWGKQPQSIPCSYRSIDGKTHTNQFLVSGWWGVARHFNYTGDLILSLAYCLATGFQSVIPYFYFVYLTILLVHRCYRDEDRCSKKYGASWKEYCAKVPYRMIPGIY